MAKWGEGDPRWIVEERPDAKNVNNWHWTEKNATHWSKDRLGQLFKSLKITDGANECIVDSVNKCTGEATVNNRKGKLIFFYEWELTLEWSGKTHSSSENTHRGKLSIPNLSEEHDLKDVEITVTIDNSNDESEVLKQFMYNYGRNKIRDLLEVYVKELKEEYSKDVILPKKNDTSEVPDKKENNSNLKKDPTPPSANVTRGNTTIGCKLDVRTLTLEDEFQCSANDLYNALTKPDMVSAFTRAPAKVDPSKGGEFHLYGGYVHGYFDELKPESRMSFRWRLKSWPSGHFSNVVLDFKEMSTSTHLKLTQTGIPATEYNTIKSNWYRYYWHSIKQTFGFGVPLADIL